MKTPEYKIKPCGMSFYVTSEWLEDCEYLHGLMREIESQRLRCIENLSTSVFSGDVLQQSKIKEAYQEYYDEDEDENDYTGRA